MIFFFRCFPLKSTLDIFKIFPLISLLWTTTFVLKLVSADLFVHFLFLLLFLQTISLLKHNTTFVLCYFLLSFWISTNVFFRSIIKFCQSRYLIIMSLKGHPDSQLKQCNADTLQEEAPYVWKWYKKPQNNLSWFVMIKKNLLRPVT